MAEWSIASDLKSEELSPVPWVRIPLSLIIENYINEKIMNTLNLYVELMDKTSCERILTMYGYSEGDKKKMLKGIK